MVGEMATFDQAFDCPPANAVQLGSCTHRNQGLCLHMSHMMTKRSKYCLNVRVGVFLCWRLETKIFKNARYRNPDRFVFLVLVPNHRSFGGPPVPFVASSSPLKRRWTGRRRK